MAATGNAPKGGHVLDLAIGESAEVALRDGTSRRITLVAVREPRDAARGVIRFPRITVEVEGERADVPAALYHMPQVVGGVRIGCSVTRGVAEAVGRSQDVYALDTDARIRCWDPDGPLFGPEPLVYPARQRWFASMTQMANERCFVNACEAPLIKPDEYVYYHYGLDIGGYDKAVPVVAAHAGQVVVRGEESVADYSNEGGATRYDRVVVRDETGWHYLYSHLDTIDPTVELGGHLAAGDPVGVLGKEGASGGWSHLHFGITSPQPSGRYGQVEGYPFLVEAYLHEHPGALLACARPHRVAAVGETVELDGSRSICDGADIHDYCWTLSNGQTVHGVRARTTYAAEGMYSEMLTVTDARGKTDLDFCPVLILPRDGDPARTPPAAQLATYPTDHIVPGQPVAFKVRTFFGRGLEANKAGEELWDFGDGTAATTCSGAPGRGTLCFDTEFGERWHAYERPGRYIVTVRRTGANGLAATAQVAVGVGDVE